MSSQNLKEYYKNLSQSGKIAPKDPFGLSHSFLMQDENNILTGDLADKQAMLSYLGDDTMVQFAVYDIEILTQMRNMGMRDENLLATFASLYYGWLGGLKITRAKDGMERMMQANAVGGYSPTSGQLPGGYGEQFAIDQRQREAEAAKNNPIKSFLSKFSAGAKQQRK